MRELSLPDVDTLQKAFGTQQSLIRAIAVAIGDTCLQGGVWRFYSEFWPTGGIHIWNEASQWKAHWRQLIPEGSIAFGEDVFGNQLLVSDWAANVLLLDHETAELFDLYCDVPTLLATGLKDGIDWIDHYQDGSLEVARQFLPVSPEMHLHWVTPLMMGGEVKTDNVSLVEREPHLVGHAKLWMQLRDLPPGTEIRPV